MKIFPAIDVPPSIRYLRVQKIDLLSFDFERSFPLLNKSGSFDLKFGFESSFIY